MYPEKMTTQVRVGANSKLLQLKRNIASQFKIKMSEFYIKTKTGPLDDQTYNEPVRDYQISSIAIAKYEIEEMKTHFPRYLIGHNIEYVNMFFDLLARSNEMCQREVLQLLENLPYNPEVKEYL